MEETRDLREGTNFKAGRFKQHSIWCAITNAKMPKIEASHAIRQSHDMIEERHYRVKICGLQNQSFCQNVCSSYRKKQQLITRRYVAKVSPDSGPEWD